MNCEQLNDRLVDYLKDELDFQTRRQFDLHLETCEHCAGELQALRSLWQDLDPATMQAPSPRVRERFYAMLNQQTAQHRHASAGQPAQGHRPAMLQWFWPMRPHWALAWSVVLLVGGAMIGRMLPLDATIVAGSNQDEEIAQIREDVSEMRELMALTLLSQGSVQARLQGIEYAQQTGAGDPQVLSLLLNTLERDDTRNVRLAVLDALTPYLDNDMVRERLYNSLLKEPSPIVQLKVVELLVRAAGDDGQGVIDELLMAGILDAEVERYLQEAGQEVI